MALLKKKEFAALCGMTTKELAVYLGPKRRKVVATGEYIDDTLPQNIIFKQHRDLIVSKKELLIDNQSKHKSSTGQNIQTLPVDIYEDILSYFESTDVFSKMIYDRDAEKKIVDLIANENIQRFIPASIVFYNLIGVFSEYFETIIKKEISIRNELGHPLSIDDQMLLTNRYSSQCKDKISSSITEINLLVDEIIEEHQ